MNPTVDNHPSGRNCGSAARQRPKPPPDWIRCTWERPRPTGPHAALSVSALCLMPPGQGPLPL